MPLVRMLTSLATPQGHYWGEGEEVKASPTEAAEWVRDGIAELVSAPEPETPERPARRYRKTKTIETR